METTGKVKTMLSGIGVRAAAATAALRRIGGPLMKALSVNGFMHICKPRPAGSAAGKTLFV